MMNYQSARELAASSGGGAPTFMSTGAELAKGVAFGTVEAAMRTTAEAAGTRSHRNQEEIPHSTGPTLVLR